MILFVPLVDHFPRSIICWTKNSFRRLVFGMGKICCKFRNCVNSNGWLNEIFIDVIVISTNTIWLPWIQAVHSSKGASFDEIWKLMSYLLPELHWYLHEVHHKVIVHRHIWSLMPKCLIKDIDLILSSNKNWMRFI